MNNNIIENLLITDIADEGKAVARHNDYVVFVDKAVPGDVVNVAVHKKRKKYIEAYVTEIKEYSTLRTDPFCEHFGICGGCKWQHMSYDAQLKFKQQQVYNALKRIGNINDPNVMPVIRSEKTTEYRNKLEYTFSDKRWLTKEELYDKAIIADNALGFHIPRMFDKVLDIRHCYLQNEPSNEIRLFIKDYAINNNLTFFNLKEQTGLLRTIILRNTNAGEWMLIVVFHHNDEIIEEMLQTIGDRFPMITSLMYVINPKRNDTIHDLEVKLFKGNPYITEQMEDFQFRIGPKSFYQTNSMQAHELYKVVREFASLTGNDVVYDLYTGTGTIANFIARQSKQVIGVEYVADAIEDAKVNSEINKVTNTSFFAGDMKDVLSENFFTANGKPDVIIIDPPRAGMHEDVVNSLSLSGAERIVYVSCNPATQARDIALMKEHYHPVKIQPVDMFPHTHHIESVALLVRN